MRAYLLPFFPVILTVDGNSPASFSLGLDNWHIEHIFFRIEEATNRKQIDSICLYG